MRVFLLAFLALALPFIGTAKPKHKKMALRGNLTAYWPMQHDPALFTVWDKVWPHANKLTAANFDPSLPVSERLVVAKIGKGILCDGGSQSLQMSSSAGVSHQGNPFTVAMWIRFESIGLSLGASVAANSEWSVTTYDDSGVLRWEVTIDGKTIPVSNAAIEPGLWNFLAFGYRVTDVGGRVWASVNMAPAITGIHTLGAPVVGPFIIGGNGTHCTFDDAMVWRRDVGAFELSAIYNDGDGLPFDEWDTVSPCASITCCD
jgi:hypothetical protein